MLGTEGASVWVHQTVHTEGASVWVHQMGAQRLRKMGVLRVRQTRGTPAAPSWVHTKCITLGTHRVLQVNKGCVRLSAHWTHEVDRVHIPCVPSGVRLTSDTSRVASRDSDTIQTGPGYKASLPLTVWASSLEFTQETLRIAFLHT